jgi:hypothetical protein
LTISGEQPGLELPFGYQNSIWEAVKRSAQDSDEIWEFSSPAKSWKLLAGRAGVCIVRNGKVIDGIVTIMN